MTISETLLKPYKRWFHPPKLDTPFSTIQMPSIKFCMVIIFISFIVISGGLVFCWVQGIPLVGYVRGNDGQPVFSWVDNSGLSSQFLAEGFLASLVYSLGSLSLMAAYYVFTNKDKDDVFIKALTAFSYTSPFWGIFSLMLFRTKISSYLPTPFR